MTPCIHDFAREARRIAQHSLTGFKDDPWVLGHFIDNELDWDKFSERLLAAPHDLPAKQWALAKLAQRYKNIAALNAAWGTTAESFAALRWPFKRDQTPSAAAARDMGELRGEFAQRWYRAWAQAIRAAAPHHLVLGSRIHLGDKYPEVIAACAKYVDVMSLNHYRLGPEVDVLERIYAIAKKPLFIGEYGHNSLDEGLLTAAVPVASEAERGIGFRYYTEQLAALPYVVGSHYFQYWDEPITGRSDTEKQDDWSSKPKKKKKKSSIVKRYSGPDPLVCGSLQSLTEAFTEHPAMDVAVSHATPDRRRQRGQPQVSSGAPCPRSVVAFVGPTGFSRYPQAVRAAEAHGFGGRAAGAGGPQLSRLTLGFADGGYLQLQPLDRYPGALSRRYPGDGPGLSGARHRRPCRGGPGSTARLVVGQRRRTGQGDGRRSRLSRSCSCRGVIVVRYGGASGSGTS